MSNSLFDTRVTRMLGIKYPIIQGAMLHISDAVMAAAVSNAGGLGQLATGHLEGKEAIRQEIRRTRELTDKPFGVNLPIGRKPQHETVEVVIEEGVSVVSMSGGNPEPYMARLKEAGVKTLCVIGGTRYAKNAERLGADAVIAMGTEAGGHIGREYVGTFVMVPCIVDAVKIPVIAAGGIGDARGFLAALALGAEAALLGTRFIATKESRAHDDYKAALIKYTEAETLVVQRKVGRTARVLRTPVAERIVEMEEKGATLEDLLPLISGEQSQKAALRGNVEAGFPSAGQVVGLIHSVPSIDELIRSMVEGAEQIVAHWRG
jgi:enoyl-[acyl-carrier protein] reductase II